MKNNFKPHPGNGGSLINTDLSALDSYILARRKLQEQQAKIEEINDSLHS